MSTFNAKKIDRLVDLLVENGIPGLSLSIRLHGEEIYRRHEGFSDHAKQIPTDGSETYNLYSCSKPITVVAAMQLVERGLMRLTDRLSDYLPEFADITVRDGDFNRPAIGDIQILHLFTMTAGLTYNTSTENLLRAREETGGLCPTREVMRYLAKDPLLFDPGKRYHYSLCHDVLAAVVEVVSGLKFSEYVKQNIFDRVGMAHSTFAPTEADIEKLAAQYRYNAETRVYDPVSGQNSLRLGSQYEAGGAGCISTLDDYAKFLEALRVGNVLLKDESLDLMLVDRLTAPQRVEMHIVDDGYSYGLGLRCQLGDSGATDFGWGGAAGAYIGCDRVHDFTFVYLQHVLSMPNFHLRHVIPFYIREGLR